MATLKFGLNIQKKPQQGPARPPPARRKPIFDDEEPETDLKSQSINAPEEIGVFDYEDGLETEKSKKNENKKLVKATLSEPPTLKSRAKKDDPTDKYGNLSSLSASQKYAEQALAEDPSIYDYDAAYDAIHAKSTAKLAAEREDALQRKPKYIENLLNSADIRKRDQLRAKDKLTQREREAEGEEFADKEKFVTETYKKQQEEVRRLEEEEKKRQEEEDRRKRVTGMSGFYRSMMAQEEKKHQETMDAAADALKSEKGLEEEVRKEKTEAELAREINAKGGNIVINDEGLVADKRQLLSSGLNVVLKPKAATAAPGASSGQTKQDNVYRGRNATQRAVRERQSRMLEEQLEQATKRAADDEAEERRKLEHASKSRKTECDISSAKERYLQRKREAAAAAAASKGS